MNRKYFAFDKNYLLKEAQISSKDTLLPELVETVKTCYQSYYNPLGLIDDTVSTIQENVPKNLEYLEDFYDDMSAIYRFKFGEVQLEFLWDGTSHLDKYKSEWRETFIQWVSEFSYQQSFVRSVFELTIFATSLTRPELIQNRLKVFLHNYFELKIYHYRGIVSNPQVA